MITKQQSKDLIASALVSYTKDVADVRIEAAVSDHASVDATNKQAGHMTAEQVTKLEGIATGAEVNQNALANVKVGSVTVQAGVKQDTVEIVAGTAISVTADADTKKVTIASTQGDYSATEAGLVPAAGTDADKFLGQTGWKALPTASTSAAGIVQLNSATNSISATQAATAKAVKDALDAAKTYADGKITALVDGAPEAMDTLKELADALNGDKDGSIVKNLLTQIGGKADSDHTHVGSDLEIGTYSTATTTGEIATTDSIAVALGKVEKLAKDANGSSDKWTTARTITVSGGVTGSVSIDGSQNVTLATTLADHASNKVTAMTGYTKATAKAAIAATDSLNTAIGKIEYKIDALTLDDLVSADTEDRTLAYFGITDAYTKKEVDDKFTALNETVTDADVTAIISAVQTKLATA